MDWQQTLLPEIRKRIPMALAIYAFGSIPKGRIHSESDLDLAVLLPPGTAIEPRDLVLWRGDFAALAGRPVDLVFLSLEQPVLCKEVISAGERLWVRDATAADEFEMYALSRYASLKEDRAEVEAAYRVKVRDG